MSFPPATPERASLSCLTAAGRDRLREAETFGLTVAVGLLRTPSSSSTTGRPLLAVADRHPSIPRAVIRRYERGDRTALVNAVVNELKGEDRRKVETRMDLLLHWRDKSAHATPHVYNSETAHLALRDLQVLANLVGSKWNEFTMP